MRNIWRLTAAGAVTGGLLAIPAGAVAAPALSAPLAPCYTTALPKGVPSIPVSLSGGGASDMFTLAISDPKGAEGSLGSTSGTFDGNGNGSATLTNIYPPKENTDPSPGQAVNLSVTDFAADGTETDTAIGSTLITNRALNLGFSYIGGNTAKEISVSGTQFANQALYGFIVHKGKVVKRISLGKANVCGFTQRKYLLIPKHAALGKYIFYVNAGPKLNKAAAISKAYGVERI